MQHVMVIVPVDAEIDEAEHVAQEHRDLWAPEASTLVAVRHLQLEHHDGDDDGNHTVAKRFDRPLFMVPGAKKTPPDKT